MPHPLAKIGFLLIQGPVKVLWLRMKDMDPRSRFREGWHFAGVTTPSSALSCPRKRLCENSYCMA
jgi:hypothetical protein